MTTQSALNTSPAQLPDAQPVQAANLAEMRGIAEDIKRLNPSLEIRYNDGLVAYVNNGAIGMIVSRVITGGIVTMFARPLNLSVNGAKPEDYTLVA